jgi:hypothetical protein
MLEEDLPEYFSVLPFYYVALWQLFSGIFILPAFFGR